MVEKKEPIFPSFFNLLYPFKEHDEKIFGDKYPLRPTKEVKIANISLFLTKFLLLVGWFLTFIFLCISLDSKDYTSEFGAAPLLSLILQFVVVQMFMETILEIFILLLIFMFIFIANSENVFGLINDPFDLPSYFLSLFVIYMFLSVFYIFLHYWIYRKNIENRVDLDEKLTYKFKFVWDKADVDPTSDSTDEGALKLADPKIQAEFEYATKVTNFFLRLDYLSCLFLMIACRYTRYKNDGNSDGIDRYWKPIFQFIYFILCVGRVIMIIHKRNQLNKKQYIYGYIAIGVLARVAYYSIYYRDKDFYHDDSNEVGISVFVTIVVVSSITTFLVFIFNEQEKNILATANNRDNDLGTTVSVPPSPIISSPSKGKTVNVYWNWDKYPTSTTIKLFKPMIRFDKIIALLNYKALYDQRTSTQLFFSYPGALSTNIRDVHWQRNTLPATEISTTFSVDFENRKNLKQWPVASTEEKKSLNTNENPKRETMASWLPQTQKAAVYCCVSFEPIDVDNRDSTKFFPFCFSATNVLAQKSDKHQQTFTVGLRYFEKHGMTSDVMDGNLLTNIDENRSVFLYFKEDQTLAGTYFRLSLKQVQHLKQVSKGEFYITFKQNMIQMSKTNIETAAVSKKLTDDEIYVIGKQRKSFQLAVQDISEDIQNGATYIYREVNIQLDSIETKETLGNYLPTSGYVVIGISKDYPVYDNDSLFDHAFVCLNGCVRIDRSSSAYHSSKLPFWSVLGPCVFHGRVGIGLFRKSPDDDKATVFWTENGNPFTYIDLKVDIKMEDAKFISVAVINGLDAYIPFINFVGEKDYLFQKNYFVYHQQIQIRKRFSDYENADVLIVENLPMNPSNSSSDHDVTQFRINDIFLLGFKKEYCVDVSREGLVEISLLSVLMKLRYFNNIRQSISLSIINKCCNPSLQKKAGFELFLASDFVSVIEAKIAAHFFAYLQHYNNTKNVYSLQSLLNEIDEEESKSLRNDNLNNKGNSIIKDSVVDMNSIVSKLNLVIDKAIRSDTVDEVFAKKFKIWVDRHQKSPSSSSASDPISKIDEFKDDNLFRFFLFLNLVKYQYGSKHLKINLSNREEISSMKMVLSVNPNGEMDSYKRLKDFCSDSYESQRPLLFDFSPEEFNGKFSLFQFLGVALRSLPIYPFVLSLVFVLKHSVCFWSETVHNFYDYLIGLTKASLSKDNFLPHYYFISYFCGAASLALLLCQVLMEGQIFISYVEWLFPIILYFIAYILIDCYSETMEQLGDKIAFAQTRATVNIVRQEELKNVLRKHGKILKDLVDIILKERWGIFKVLLDSYYRIAALVIFLFLIILAFWSSIDDSRFLYRSRDDIIFAAFVFTLMVLMSLLTPMRTLAEGVNKAHIDLPWSVRYRWFARSFMRLAIYCLLIGLMGLIIASISDEGSSTSDSSEYEEAEFQQSHIFGISVIGWMYSAWIGGFAVFIVCIVLWTRLSWMMTGKYNLKFKQNSSGASSSSSSSPSPSPASSSPSSKRSSVAESGTRKSINNDEEDLNAQRESTPVIQDEDEDEFLGARGFVYPNESLSIAARETLCRRLLRIQADQAEIILTNSKQKLPSYLCYLTGSLNLEKFSKASLSKKGVEKQQLETLKPEKNKKNKKEKKKINTTFQDSGAGALLPVLLRNDVEVEEDSIDDKNDEFQHDIKLPLLLTNVSKYDGNVANDDASDRFCSLAVLCDQILYLSAQDEGWVSTKSFVIREFFLTIYVFVHASVALICRGFGFCHEDNESENVELELFLAFLAFFVNLILIWKLADNLMDAYYVYMRQQRAMFYVQAMTDEIDAPQVGLPYLDVSTINGLSCWFDIRYYLQTFNLKAFKIYQITVAFAVLFELCFIMLLVLLYLFEVIDHETGMDQVRMFGIMQLGLVLMLIFSLFSGFRTNLIRAACVRKVKNAANTSSKDRLRKEIVEKIADQEKEQYFTVKFFIFDLNWQMLTTLTAFTPVLSLVLSRIVAASSDSEGN